MKKYNDIKFILKIFDELNLSYVLIRPICSSNISLLEDIDISMPKKDLYILLKFLRENNIKFSCLETYTSNNKILLKIEDIDVLLDINIDGNYFTDMKTLKLDIDYSKSQFFYIQGIKYNILQEPYLFIHWTLHYILDKKSFQKGSSYKEYYKRYIKTYEEFLKSKEVEQILYSLFKKNSKKVKKILLENLFLSNEVLGYNIIKEIYKMAFSCKDYGYYYYFKIKIFLLKRINRYVFRNFRPIRPCIR